MNNNIWQQRGGAGFKLTSQGCMVKSSNKISLLLVSPKYTFGWSSGSKNFEILDAADS